VANETINAAQNPDLVNNLVDKALAETTTPTPQAEIQLPSDNTVNLPGGYITSAGEVVRTAEVRELNGRDEEIIARTTNAGKMFSTILARGVVKIGDETATDALLDALFAGDRDALLIGIFKATFGSSTNIETYCAGCNDFKTVDVNVDSDIKSRVLIDPINDRKFTLQGRKDEYLVTLPTGVTQRELAASSDKTMAELNTLLLEQTVVEINNQPVISKNQIKNIGLVDRRTIGDEIAKRNPGPRFEDTTIECPDCGGEVVVPINLGTLFRF
jgi:hypothetical protein